MDHRSRCLDSGPEIEGSGVQVFKIFVSRMGSEAFVCVRDHRDDGGEEDQMKYSKVINLVGILFVSVVLSGCQPRHFAPAEMASFEKVVDPTCQSSVQKLLIPGSISVGEKVTFSFNRKHVNWIFFDPITEESTSLAGSPLELIFVNPGLYKANVNGTNECDQVEGREFTFTVLAPAPTTTTTTTTTTSTTTTSSTTTSTTTTSTTTTTLPPIPPPPIVDLEKAKPFFDVVETGFGFPWESDSGGCLRTGFAEPTFAVFPVCESRANLTANSNKFSALFFDINQVSLSPLNSQILFQWIQIANQQFKGLSIQITGHISNDQIEHRQVGSIMGQRLISTLNQIAHQTTHPQVVTVKVAVRGVEQFSCQVDLNQNILKVQGCLSQARRYPQTFPDLGFYIDQVFIGW